MPTLIITRDEIRSLITMDRVIQAVETAFLAHGRGQVDMPAKVYIDLPAHRGDFRAMPAYMAGAAGVKWVNSHPDNPDKHGLPSVMGVYILSDPATALPLAVMDATWLTALRTGAAGAIASKYLAVARPRTLGFVGCGVQARVLLAAHREVYTEHALELRMADIDDTAARTFAAEAGGEVGSIERASACDIVCTSTPSRTPVVERAWVKDGAHVNAMGADAEGKQELSTELLQVARVVIDDREQAFHSGEVNVPSHAGAFQESDVHATLGEVVAGTKSGRTGAEITIFDSTGLAVQDVAVARVIYELAREKGVGTEVALVG